MVQRRWERTAYRVKEAEVAGQLISHFFDEDSRDSRCFLCHDTSSNNGFFEWGWCGRKGNEVELNKIREEIDDEIYLKLHVRNLHLRISMDILF